MESYVLERFTASQTPDECFENIYSSTYLLYPYQNYYLCLKENWLDTDNDVVDGYPEKMKITVASSMIGECSFFSEKDSITFDTDLMLPRLSDDTAEATVYYFSPVHFDGKLLGYSVLQRNIHDNFKMNLVYRNWLRFVNNALEMIRAKRQLLALSVRDEMTGLYNRRGMYIELEKMLKNTKPNLSVFVCVIDMDGLKYINDTFGHNEGDSGIRIISSAVSLTAVDNEVCVRAGGDEFYIIGVGNYDADKLVLRAEKFEEIIKKISSAKNKPYEVTASIGCVLHKFGNNTNIDEIIHEADEKMYKYKTDRKRQRNL